MRSQVGEQLRPGGAAPGLPNAWDDWLGDDPTEEFDAFALPAGEPGVLLFTVFPSAVMGVRISASTESMRYCGVCTATE